MGKNAEYYIRKRSKNGKTGCYSCHWNFNICFIWIYDFPTVFYLNVKYTFASG